MSNVEMSGGSTVTVSESRALAAAFTMTSFLAAFLLFLLEPMVAKMLLPSLGGSPAVWNTAMVFFQATLLVGYAVAHVSLRRLQPRAHATMQIALVVAVLVTLPVALPTGWQAPQDVAPAAWTLLALLVMVGAPFALLATLGPTLQRWFSYTRHPRADDPYFLYAAGNAGSLLALLAYPLVLEPVMTLTAQARLWTVLYMIFVLACIACAGVMVRQARLGVPTVTTVRSSAPTIARRRQARWVFLAFVPSALMLGVTRYLSSDIAAVPLLWIAPLSLYLMTFIVAFGRGSERIVRGSARVFRVLAIPLALSFIGIVPDLRVQLPLQLGAFTVAALLAHGRLAADRPEVDNLTRFFLLVAVGGVLGGIFAALIAPVVFNSVMEYPIAIVLALAILPSAAVTSPRRRNWALPVVAVVIAVGIVAIRSDGSQRGLTLAMLIAAAGLVASFALARTPLEFAGAVGAIMVLSLLFPANATLFEDRTFFGVSRVYQDGQGGHILVSGGTVHGIQNQRGGSLDAAPAAYYSRQGPAGDLFTGTDDPGPRRVAVIGAGAGSLASYLRAGDTLTFFEIDEAVEHIATDPSLFTYVRDSPGHVDFVLGDGRLEIARSAGAYDLVVVDAFSGDAIPTHLVTREAVRTYVDEATEHGLVAFNISNRYFDLRPVLARIAQEEGLAALVRSDPATAADQRAGGALASTWVVLAPSSTDIAGLEQAPGWEALTADADAPLWTDDYTDLLETFVAPWG